jgi:hypothetical protein
LFIIHLVTLSDSVTTLRPIHFFCERAVVVTGDDCVVNQVRGVTYTQKLDVVKEESGVTSEPPRAQRSRSTPRRKKDHYRWDGWRLAMAAAALRFSTGERSKQLDKV